MPISMRSLFTRYGVSGDIVSLRHSLEQHLGGIGISLRTAHERFLTLDTGSGYDCGCRSPDSLSIHLAGLASHNVGNVLPAWVRADPRDHRNRARVVEGVLLRAKITNVDFPLKPWHTFHDWNFLVKVDRQYRYLLNDETREHHSIKILSKGAEPEDIIENEWDSTFVPLWAVPQPDVRVWMMGRWIYDCGHPPEVVVRVPLPAPSLGPDFFEQTVYTRSKLDELISKGGAVIRGDPERLGRHRLELHPLRAIASFASEAALLDGNRAPTQATRAVVYIGHQGGYIRQSINDQDYAFDVHLPPRPRRDAAPAWCTSRPLGTLPAEPVVSPFPAREPRRLRVRIPLKDVSSVSEYGLILSAGWNDPDGAEAAKIRHYRVVIQRVIRLDKPRETKHGPVFEPMIFFIGVNGRWLRKDIKADQSLLDFTTELWLHPDDRVCLTACGFIRGSIARFLGDETGIPDAMVSSGSSIEDARSAAVRIAKAFVGLDFPLSESNPRINMLLIRHRPQDARPKLFQASSKDFSIAGEDKSATDYEIEYTFEQIPS